MSKKYLKQQHRFSPTLRQEIVQLIETGKINVSSASREYGVSTTSIYRWIHRYSTYNKKGNTLVVDTDSQTSKIQQLEREKTELAQALGYKQMQLDYYEKYIEFANEELDEEVKKKFNPSVSNGFLAIKARSTGK